MNIESEAEDVERIAAASKALEGKDPRDVPRWASKQYSPDIALACSFGGPSGMALPDMSMRIDPGVHVFFLDTDFLFPET